MHTKRKRRFYAFCGQFIGRALIVIIMNAVVWSTKLQNKKIFYNSSCSRYLMIYKMRISAAFHYLFLPPKVNLLKTKIVIWFSIEKKLNFSVTIHYFLRYIIWMEIFLFKKAPYLLLVRWWTVTFILKKPGGQPVNEWW